MGRIKFKMRSAGCLLLLAGLCITESACDSPVAQSHIDANVPDSTSFDAFMERDLTVYFEKTLETSGKIHVDYQLLRKGSTQTGISYPKFYVWAKIFSGSRILTEGAVSVAAVDGTQFTVTDFLGKDQIAAEPEKINTIFPAALNAKILALAATK
jgi:hypothetical protein